MTDPPPLLPERILPERTAPLRILVADDQPVLREGIRRSFEAAGEVVVAAVGDGHEAVAAARRHRPDVVLVDLSLPDPGGVGTTRLVRQSLPDTKVIVLTLHEDVEDVRRAVEAGAAGFLSKGASFHDVLATVRAVAAGDVGFSPALAAAVLELAREPVVIDLDADDVESLLSDRQVEILQAIAHGESTKQVARRFDITQKTVHNHLNAIYRRLDTQSLTHAVLSAVRLGIIELD
jgi:DNA-binding NarL/FixJ family response regulator